MSWKYRTAQKCIHVVPPPSSFNILPFDKVALGFKWLASSLGLKCITLHTVHYISVQLCGCVRKEPLLNCMYVSKSANTDTYHSVILKPRLLNHEVQMTWNTELLFIWRDLKSKLLNGDCSVNILVTQTMLRIMPSWCQRLSILAWNRLSITFSFDANSNTYMRKVYNLRVYILACYLKGQNIWGTADVHR
jgi:hypothetical protein